MTQTTVTDSAETTLPRLDDDGRALLFTSARTANTFSDRLVGEEQLREIYELMKWGPTWANTLPLRIVYVTTPQGKARLLPHLQPGNAGKATQAPVNAILAADSAFHYHLPRLLPSRPEMGEALQADPQLRERIGTGSAWLQAAYFIVAVRAAGLAARPIAMRSERAAPTGGARTLLREQLSWANAGGADAPGRHRGIHLAGPRPLLRRRAAAS
jgi:3-hydroxypropanoate dehydrogenase